VRTIIDILREAPGHRVRLTPIAPEAIHDLFEISNWLISQSGPNSWNIHFCPCFAVIEDAVVNALSQLGMYERGWRYRESDFREGIALEGVNQGELQLQVRGRITFEDLLGNTQEVEFRWATGERPFLVLPESAPVISEASTA
jgi:hypothetical protein